MKKFIRKKLAQFVIGLLNEFWREGDEAEDDRLIKEEPVNKTKEPIPTGEFDDDGYW